jgi:hypothetical protein
MKSRESAGFLVLPWRKTTVSGLKNKLTVLSQRELASWSKHYKTKSYRAKIIRGLENRQCGEKQKKGPPEIIKRERLKKWSTEITRQGFRNSGVFLGPVPSRSLTSWWTIRRQAPPCIPVFPIYNPHGIQNEILACILKISFGER